MHQPGAFIFDPNAVAARRAEAKRRDEEQRIADEKRRAYEESNEGRAMARAEAQIRKNQAAAYAAERLAAAEAAAKVSSDAQFRQRAEAALGGAATPELVEAMVAKMRADETSGRRLLRYDGRR